MRVGAVTRGYFALGSRFSRLPVNFPRYLPRDLADRETAGGGGGEGRKKRNGPPRRTYCHCGRTPTRGTRFLTARLTKLGPT